eukprot:scaffold990_cov393-Prasinococcus_capsulatus_cf.AAC.17
MGKQRLALVVSRHACEPLRHRRPSHSPATETTWRGAPSLLAPAAACSAGEGSARLALHAARPTLPGQLRPAAPTCRR